MVRKPKARLLAYGQRSSRSGEMMLAEDGQHEGQGEDKMLAAGCAAHNLQPVHKIQKFVIHYLADRAINLAQLCRNVCIVLCV